MPRRRTAADVPEELKVAVQTYLLARCHAELEREKIDAMERQILAEIPLHLANEWKERGMRDVPEIITEPCYVYLARDEEREDYHAECQHRIKQMGYNVPEGHCPALIAEDLQLQSEWSVIESGAKMIGDSNPKTFNDRLLCGTKTMGGLEAGQHFLDLLVGLVVNLPGFKSPLQNGSIAYGFATTPESEVVK